MRQYAQGGNEFNLYRMLLITQLAHLADPNNLRVDPSIKRDIEIFAQDKLGIDPKVVFNEVLNQGLFIEDDRTGPTINDPLETPRSLSNIAQVGVCQESCRV